MSFDRRVMLAAGCGFAGIGLAAAAASPAAAQSNGRTPRRVVPRAPERPSGADDTAGLQAAIDDAAATREPLLLGPGRFLVRGLELRAGVHIRGAGQATVLVQSGSAPVLKGSSVDAATLERFAVEGRGGLTADGQALIEVRRSRGISIRHVALTGSSASALMLERCSGIVSGCRISLASKAGIFSLDADDGLEISHNAISDIGNNGILVWRSAIGEDGTIVTMNRIERIAARDGGTGQNGNAINVFRAGGVLVTTNRISDCAFSAVRANSASNVQIIANNVTRVGEVALYAEFAFQGAVISTNLIDGAATGISVTNFDHGGRLAVIQGNLVRNLSLHTGPSDPGGYGISVEADAAVTGNTIEGAPSAGIQIGWGRFCRDVAATGNVIRNCAIGIAVAADAKAGPALVAANMISGAARGAIRTMDHSRPVGEDLASSPPASGRIRTIANVVA